ncbi:MAG TPA: helix-turn-helix domain-containing protein [Luteolibacter sp.]|nr:helix-turn-helix domain-containing protein [Luteolibacter sp.]
MKKRFDVRGFLDRVDWEKVARDLGALLLEDAFFMKDADGRFVMQNRRAWEYCNAAGESETLGLRDADFWPGERARLYNEGDRLVMKSGEAVVNQLAPAPEEAGSDNMIAYSKFPVRDRDGRIIGVAGIHRRIDERSSRATPFGVLYRAVRRIHDEFANDGLRMEELARLTGLSQSQFNRRFKAVLGVSPKEYQLRVRVRTACRLLESTDWTVARIASHCGFHDHSHFTHTFRRQTGQSPGNYRAAHAGGA